MSKAYWQADAIATGIELASANNRLADVQADLHTAYANQGGALALLAAFGAALRECAPDHPLYNVAVRRVIDADGRRVYQQTGNLSGCWELNHDPQAILDSLEARHREAVAHLLPQVASAEIQWRSALLVLRRPYFLDWPYHKLEVAQAVKDHMLQQLNSHDLSMPTDIRGLRIAAHRALGLTTIGL